MKLNSERSVLNNIFVTKSVIISFNGLFSSLYSSVCLIVTAPSGIDFVGRGILRFPYESEMMLLIIFSKSSSKISL